MEPKGFCQRHENKIIATVLIALLMLFIGLRYDYYYDLNDDVMIKDILSGVYTGVPEGHNIQLQYPLSLGISLLYRLFPDAPVYGIFLILCQYGALWMLVERSLQFRSGTVSKAAVSAVFGLSITALLLQHLVFIQYTFTSAMLAAAAAYWFITSQEASPGKFIRENIPALLAAVFSYMLRSEMLLLLLPFICVAGIYRWSTEQKVWQKENFCKYLTVVGLILFGMGVTAVIHRAAFGSEEWKRYTAFFDSRTQLYDFQGIPSYEGNEAFYQELGMAESEYEMLLHQYNFGLDDTLTAEQLDAISEYQAAQKAKDQSAAAFAAELVQKGKLYLYRMSHKEPVGLEGKSDYPWNLMAVFGYLMVLIMMLWTRQDDTVQPVRRVGTGICMLVLLFCVRTALWMFILMRGRDPVRITHSLYLMEFWILLAILHAESTGLQVRIANLVRATVIFPSVFAIVSVTILGTAVSEADSVYESREQANRVERGIKEYCRKNPENFYFEDVYSSVSYPSEPYAGTPYSEKLFADVDNRLGNYDIMGGWQVKSPSYEKKLEAFGMESMSRGLLEKDNVYFLAELAKGTDAFVNYFVQQGIRVQIECEDTICDIIGVYRIYRTDETSNYF